MKGIATDGPEVIPEGRVSHETLERLAAYVALLRRWQKTQNLISSGDVEQIWRRHVLDSLEAIRLFPETKRWLDLGSGAGFPGMVTAIALAGKDGAHVTLVESNHGKCAFLNAAIRATGAPAEIRSARIDSVVEQWRQPLDMISARALAPLGDLCGMVAPLLRDGTRAVFHKGREFDRELVEASKYWGIDLVKHPNTVSKDGWLVEIRSIQPREDLAP